MSKIICVERQRYDNMLEVVHASEKPKWLPSLCSVLRPVPFLYRDLSI